MASRALMRKRVKDELDVQLDALHMAEILEGYCETENGINKFGAKITAEDRAAFSEARKTTVELAKTMMIKVKACDMQSPSAITMLDQCAYLVKQLSRDDKPEEPTLEEVFATSGDEVPDAELIDPSSDEDQPQPSPIVDELEVKGHVKNDRVEVGPIGNDAVTGVYEVNFDKWFSLEIGDLWDQSCIDAAADAADAAAKRKRKRKRRLDAEARRAKLACIQTDSGEE